MLGARNNSQTYDFYTRDRHENFEVYYISQSYFGLPKQSIRNNCDRLILFRQTIKDVQSMYYDIGAYDMLYSENKKYVIKPGVKDLTIYILIWLKTKMMVTIVFSVKAKTYTLNAFPKVNLFKVFEKKHEQTFQMTRKTLHFNLFPKQTQLMFPKLLNVVSN